MTTEQAVVENLKELPPSYYDLADGRTRNRNEKEGCIDS